MRIQLTVIDGPRLVWNGTPVRASAELLATLRPGMTVVAKCLYGDELTVDDAHPLQVVVNETGPAALIAAGQFDAALRVLEAQPQTADTLAFRARALLERHRDSERRTAGTEEADRDAGMAALTQSLQLGGPDVTVSAPNSPWACWRLLFRDEREPFGFGCATELFSWVWRALLRTPLDELGDFSPFTPLLSSAPPELWPRPPWLAWGLTPKSVSLDAFAWAICDRVEHRAPTAKQRELIHALRTGTQPPKGARRGNGVAGLLSGLQVALHSSRPNPPVEIALAALRSLKVEERLEWFSLLNEALAIAAVEADLAGQRRRPSAPIARVLFRAWEFDWDVSPSISALTNGRLLAITSQEGRAKRKVLLLEGGVDEVVAAMPEHHFPVAVVAVRQALSEPAAPAPR